MSCSAIFILDQKGRVLISRNYRGDIPMTVATRFAAHIVDEEESQYLPVINEEGITYVSVKQNNLYCMSFLGVFF